MRSATLPEQGGTFFKQIVDKRTESLLKHIAERAASKGMKINAAKTNLMCVSAASTFEAKVQVELHGQTIHGQDNMKVLGVTIDSDGSFKTHVENLRSKLRKRTWALSRLRRRGIPEDKLIKTYTSLIRPVVEYASPSWHSLLTAEQSEKLERQQTQDLKNVFGANLSAAKMRNKANIKLLHTRRVKAAKKFANKCLTNKRCTDWFVERPSAKYARRSSISYPKFKEKTARTDRFRNSPKNFLVRLLNND